MGASSGFGNLPARFDSIPIPQRRQIAEVNSVFPYGFLSCPLSTVSGNSTDNESTTEARLRVVAPMDQIGPQRERNLCASPLEKDFPLQRPSAYEANSESLADDAQLASAVPVFVMLPLDTVNVDGTFKYSSSNWFYEALSMLVMTGVKGVAVDVWWGAVEKEPRAYDWSGYRDLVKLIKQTGLLLQVVLSFHACGGNVGDIVQIPLPQWVLQCGECDPDIFLSDRPRQYKTGQRNREYLSLFADEVPGLLCGRSPMECYTDFMAAFRDEFEPMLGTLIVDVVVGAGPCGELRYPSYSEGSGWRFPGVGEFQCYDRFALSSLAKAAADAGHPEWGHSGPHDAGEYNNWPRDAAFFSPNSGSWNTSYGKFFLDWYSNALILHGRRLVSAATIVFASKLSQRRSYSKEAASAMHCIRAWLAKTSGRICGSPSTASATDVRLSDSSADLSARTNSMTSILRDTSLDSFTRETSYTNGHFADFNSDVPYSNVFDVESGTFKSICILPPLQPITTQPVATPGSSSTESTSDDTNNACSKRCDVSDANRRLLSCLEHETDGYSNHRTMQLSLKIAGVHWWYKTKSHAAELTAGYYNAGDRCGYEAIVRTCREFNVGLTLTCVEMSDAQHSAETCCSPQGLLDQIRKATTAAGVRLSGENALPLFYPAAGGVDARGLDRIVDICQGDVVDVLGSVGDRSRIGRDDGPLRNKAHLSRLARMHSFTFLRLGPEIMHPMQRPLWEGFMRRMHDPQTFGTDYLRSPL